MGRILMPPGRVQVWVPDAPFPVAPASFRSLSSCSYTVLAMKGNLGEGTARRCLEARTPFSRDSRGGRSSPSVFGA